MNLCLISQHPKNTASKLRVLFYLADKTEDLSWGHTASQVALGDGSKEVRKEPGGRGVLQQRLGSQNIKRLLLIKESQTFQVKEFSAFLI